MKAHKIEVEILVNCNDELAAELIAKTVSDFVKQSYDQIGPQIQTSTKPWIYKPKGGKVIM